VGALVELTGRAQVERGHDLATLQEISRRTGLALIVGVGLYKEPFAPWIAAADVDEVADRLVTMATEASAGILGEVGTSLDEITVNEEKCLRASARAHLRTGLALSTHCTLGTMAAEQVAILVEEGVDLSRVVIGHVDLKPDVEALDEVLGLGVTIGFDTFGKQWFDYQVPGSRGSGGGEFIKWAYRRTDDARLGALVELLNRGWERQIVLSSDMSGREAYLNSDTHGRYGYTFLHARVLPALRETGVGEQAIRSMVVDNPARILSVG
jgi:phosphotriesterase-related protein